MCPHVVLCGLLVAQFDVPDLDDYGYHPVSKFLKSKTAGSPSQLTAGNCNFATAALLSSGKGGQPEVDSSTKTGWRPFFTLTEALLGHFSSVEGIAPGMEKKRAPPLSWNVYDTAGKKLNLDVNGLLYFIEVAQIVFVQ
ncbi:hypothetical protein CEXT_465481 [Caerostris extrusa]|uniref:Uncharacterized protein n=1 Tax=Caerostris extrusa TaxID=172846 RepID=A0AAV4N0K2_CAEEX|nr:hypothetical protein CEXT_465481 [Caerostris extrusa]